MEVGWRDNGDATEGLAWVHDFPGGRLTNPHLQVVKRLLGLPCGSKKSTALRFQPRVCPNGVQLLTLQAARSRWASAT